ncbi:hypothetical protein GQ600_24162 [Phytophthora cactorum]|nr:hypothetical protein GQ600_24162 [Phytophthora cactorum]
MISCWASWSCSTDITLAYSISISTHTMVTASRKPSTSQTV